MSLNTPVTGNTRVASVSTNEKQTSIRGGASGLQREIEHIPYYTTDILADKPYRSSDFSVSWEFSLIKRAHGNQEDNVGVINTFHTGIAFNVPKGYYLEIMGNRLLHQYGFYIVGGHIIVDSSDRDEIMVDLIKYKEGEDLVLPGKFLKILVHKAVRNDFDLMQPPTNQNSQSTMNPMMNPALFNQMMGLMQQQPGFQQNSFQNTGNYSQRILPSRPYSGNGLC